MRSRFHFGAISDLVVEITRLVAADERQEATHLPPYRPGIDLPKSGRWEERHCKHLLAV